MLTFGKYIMHKNRYEYLKEEGTIVDKVTIFVF
jgi:hypothetical protein